MQDTILDVRVILQKIISLWMTLLLILPGQCESARGRVESLLRLRGIGLLFFTFRFFARFA